MGYQQFNKAAVQNELGGFDLTRVFSLQGGGINGIGLASAPELPVDNNTLEQSKIKNDPSPT